MERKPGGYRTPSVATRILSVISKENYQVNPGRGCDKVLPDSKRIVTGSDDNTTRIWDASTGRELARLATVKNGWFSLHFIDSGTPPRFRAAGEGLRILRYRDRNDRPAPAPWIPREWMAADLVQELQLDESPWLPGNRKFIAALESRLSQRLAPGSIGRPNKGRTKASPSK
jgi:hypothetical protein